MFCARNYQRSGFITFKVAKIDELLLSLRCGKPCRVVSKNLMITFIKIFRKNATIVFTKNSIILQLGIQKIGFLNQPFDPQNSGWIGSCLKVDP